MQLTETGLLNYPPEKSWEITAAQFRAVRSQKSALEIGNRGKWALFAGSTEN
jgi:hypothetical protein